MKKLVFSAILLATTGIFAQVGIGTQNPQGIFNVDGASDNAATGVPTTAQQANDFTVLANGNVGIGTNAPNAQLQFAGNIANRKVVLYEANNNDNQYYGFGINPGVLRYQVESTTTNHVFYAGASATTSNELMRIQGNGNIGIGTNAPTAKLDMVSANNDPTTNIASFRTNNLSQGLGVSFAGIFKIGTNTNSNLNIAAKGTGDILLGTVTSGISSTGNVGIGTATPNQKLDVVGIAEFTSTNAGANYLRIEGGGIDSTNPRIFINSGAIELQSNESTATNRILSIANDASERVTVLANGNVGIGISAPTNKLDVNGSLRVRNVPYEDDYTNGRLFSIDEDGNVKRMNLSTLAEYIRVINSCTNTIPAGSFLLPGSDAAITNFGGATSGKFYVNLNFFTPCEGKSANLKAFVDLSAKTISVETFTNFSGSVFSFNQVAGNLTSSVVSNGAAFSKIEVFLTGTTLSLRVLSNACASGTRTNFNGGCYSASSI